MTRGPGTVVMRRQAASTKWLPGIPEWEAAKAHRRSLGHAEAVAECAALSELYRQMWQREAAGMVDLRAILRLKNVLPR